MAIPAATAPGLANPVEAAAVPAPAVLSAYANPATLGAHGGRTLIVSRVKTSVTSCQLKLLSHQSFPVVYSTNARRCHVNFYAYVTVGANTRRTYRTVAFEVIGRNASGQFSRNLVYLSLSPKGSSYKAPPPPVVKIEAPPPAAPTKPKPAAPLSPGYPGMPVSYESSENWSGYEVLDGAVTSVHGTFTVPTLKDDETCQTYEAQWVGIDGGATSDHNLIQAGVLETPYNNNGTCEAPSYYYIYPWWEILPATETYIGSLTVKPGDTVSVSIWDSSPGSSYWRISLLDRTNGGSFHTTEYYTGSGASAEWVTESATNTINCPGVDGHPGQCVMTGYSPSVTFSNLGYDATFMPYKVVDVTMEQQGWDVSTPSEVANLGQLLRQGFSTSFTGY